MLDRSCRYCGLSTLMGRCRSLREADRCFKHLTPVLWAVGWATGIVLGCLIINAVG